MYLLTGFVFCSYFVLKVGSQTYWSLNLLLASLPPTYTARLSIGEKTFHKVPILVFFNFKTV